MAGGEVSVDVGKPLVLWTKDDSQAVADEMKRRIVDRTRTRSIGADGEPFRPYKKKKRAGAPVTLTKTGKMLNTLAPRGTPRRAALRTSVAYAAIQDRLRPWFGFTEAEWDEILADTAMVRIDGHLSAASAKGE